MDGWVEIMNDIFKQVKEEQLKIQISLHSTFIACLFFSVQGCQKYVNAAWLNLIELMCEQPVMLMLLGARFKSLGEQSQKGNDIFKKRKKE